MVKPFIIRYNLKIFLKTHFNLILVGMGLDHAIIIKLCRISSLLGTLKLRFNIIYNYIPNSLLSKNRYGIKTQSRNLNSEECLGKWPLAVSVEGPFSGDVISHKAPKGNFTCDLSAARGNCEMHALKKRPQWSGSWHSYITSLSTHISKLQLFWMLYLNCVMAFRNAMLHVGEQLFQYNNCVEVNLT